ncbi:heparinase II/III family protein [Opitutales bacterium]|nr:heparinase II/III family protein [Opitutales bacterium]
MKGQQLFYQVAYRVRRYVFCEKPQASKEVLGVSSTWPKNLDLLRPTGVDACLDRDEWYFKFINLEHRFGSDINWEGGPHGKLWNYNLHYFEWLWGIEPDTAKTICLDWIERHPFLKDAEGWEPYTLSLRVTNWVGYWGSRGLAILEKDAVFAEALFHSLSLQCDWLTKRLEKHILGNHYLENGVALWIAGAFLEKGDASKWLSVGQQILDEQLAEQMLEDGMHFERSPMYHNRLLWILSWLSAIDEGQFRSRKERATVAARMLKHPDGKVALFNDSAFGIYPVVDGEAPLGTFAMESSGYYGMRTEANDYLVCDAGRIGPDYIPGHSHCDIGSFELSIAGQRFITDTGVYHYLNTKKRHHSRATVAHNVFAPEGVEQAEIWSAFRVGDRPDVFADEWDAAAENFHLRVSHTGFEQVGVSVSRTFDYDGAHELLITDRFEADEKANMLGQLHFSPEVNLLECNGNTVRLMHCGHEVSIFLENVDALSIGESEYYPEFNVCITRPCLKYSVTGKTGEVKLRIEWNR